MSTKQGVHEASIIIFLEGVIQTSSQASEVSHILELEVGQSAVRPVVVGLGSTSYQHQQEENVEAPPARPGRCRPLLHSLHITCIPHPSTW